MANLADELRKENSEKFNVIKEELTNLIVEQIRKYGHCKVLTYKTCKGVEVDNYYGIFVDVAFRVPVKEHFESLGFVVKDRYIGYGNTHAGYDIML